MVQIPKQNQILDALDLAEATEQHFGNYLGMSEVGHECIRYMQYKVRRAFKDYVPPKLQRIFDMGKMLEPRIMSNLEAIGATITEEQFTVFDVTGCWKGKGEALITGLPGCEKTKHVLEIKTHNQKNFDKLEKERNLKLAHPKHYAQITIYMKYKGVDRGLYVAYNKNTSAYYVERIYYDEAYAKDLERKMMEILMSESLYPRIGTGTKTWYACKYCPAKEVCFQEEKPRKSCRTCEHVLLTNENIWQCTLQDNKTLEIKEQIAACDSYVLEEFLK